jgi:hypothetical protein
MAWYRRSRPGSPPGKVKAAGLARRERSYCSALGTKRPPVQIQSPPPNSQATSAARVWPVNCPLSRHDARESASPGGREVRSSLGLAILNRWFMCCSMETAWRAPGDDAETMWRGTPAAKRQHARIRVLGKLLLPGQAGHSRGSGLSRQARLSQVSPVSRH